MEVPRYDRSRLVPAVLHLGIGGFHRAHQAAYFDLLAEHRNTLRWGIVGVNLRRPLMRDALEAQDFLYTLVERDDGLTRARVVGSIIGCHYAPESPDRVLNLLASPTTKIVTLTITGDAYQPDTSGAVEPLTAPAYIVEALRRRRAARIDPFTVMSCDNVPRNGQAARAAVVGSAATRDPGLAEWIENRVSFPSSVVDRITPQTSDSARALVRDEYGLLDRSPVISEPYTDWIIEDDFCNGRPPLELVGARFVPDTAPFERAKKRMLNGAHCALGYLGTLAGLDTCDETASAPAFRRYLEMTLDHEIAPLLGEETGLDLRDYRRILVDRFSNPEIGDRLSRLAARGSVKMPAYLLPSVHEALEEERPCPGLTLAVAAWIRYLQGEDLNGRPIEVVDAISDRLQHLARSGAGDPRPVLAETELFGDLGEHPRFVAAVTEAIDHLERNGVEGSIDALLTPNLEVAA